MANNLLTRLKLFTAAVSNSGGSGSAIWGAITGVLSSQSDLQNALDAKLTKNTIITGATKTKITYDDNGLVTSGTDATTADINDSTNRRYVTDAQSTVLSNTSGTNTGDETKTSIVNKLALISGSITVDFSNTETDLIVTTVNNVNVTASTKFNCVVENYSPDHSGEDVQIENIIANVINVIPGVSFDVITVAHNLTWGRYTVTYKELI